MILDFRGFDKIIILMLRGGILMSKVNFPDIMSQQSLRRDIDVTRELGVMWPCGMRHARPDHPRPQAATEPTGRFTSITISIIIMIISCLTSITSIIIIISSITMIMMMIISFIMIIIIIISITSIIVIIIIISITSIIVIIIIISIGIVARPRRPPSPSGCPSATSPTGRSASKT